MTGAKDEASGKREDRVRKVGSALAGGAAAAGINMVAGGGGFLAAPFVAATTDELLHRALSKRQKVRVSAVSSFAQKAYQELLGEGYSLRSDDFFEDRDGRWSANEVVEAVLISASNQPSELKLEFLGHMLAVFAVDDSIDVPSAHWLLHTAEDLSWQQYVQLSLVGRKHEFDLPSIEVGQRWSNWREFSSVFQFVDLGLYERNLVVGEVTEDSKGKLLPVHSLDLQDQALSSHGQVLYDVLGLSRVSTTAVEEELEIWRHISVLD